MKFRDMLRMSGSSLWKRKVRTILTVLGVVIGTASIVVMISLGLGLKRASMSEIEQYGGLTTITVSEQGSYYGGYDDSETEIQASTEHLSDDVVETIRGIEHVEDVYPVLDTEALALSGGYQSYISLRGVSAEKMKDLGIKLGQGEFPEPNAGQLQAVYGNMVIGEFHNEKTGQGYWYNGEMAEVDLMADTIMYVFDMDAYYNFLWGNTAEDGICKGKRCPAGRTGKA